jgi:hypothetical protein
MAPDTLDYALRLEGIGEPFALDTRDVREALGGVPLSEPDAVMWMRESLEEAIAPYRALDNEFNRRG